jgi:hypothetical protein
MPSVWTIEGAGGKRRRRGKRRGGAQAKRFKRAHKTCTMDGYKPFTKPFGACMKRELAR